MQQPPFFSAILFLHIAAGLVLVGVGLVPLLSRKGGPTHRAWGKVFVALMSVLLIAAWVMTILNFRPYFAALSVMATVSLTSGVRVLRRKRPDLDPRQTARLFDWLVLLGAVGIGGYVFWLLQTGEIVGQRTIAYTLVGSAALYAVWDGWRFLAPTAFPFFPDLWFYEHLFKMMGTYAAALSAFAGNFLPFLPSPWRELWPTLLFETLTVAAIAYYAIARRRRARETAPLAA